MKCNFTCQICRKQKYNETIRRQKYCSTCYRTGLKSGIIKKIEQKYKYNLQTFYNEDAISYYLLGAFITDGNINIEETVGNSQAKIEHIIIATTIAKTTIVIVISYFPVGEEKSTFGASLAPESA